MITPGVHAAVPCISDEEIGFPMVPTARNKDAIIRVTTAKNMSVNVMSNPTYQWRLTFLATTLQALRRSQLEIRYLEDK